MSVLALALARDRPVYLFLALVSVNALALVSALALAIPSRLAFCLLAPACRHGWPKPPLVTVTNDSRRWA